MVKKTSLLNKLVNRWRTSAGVEVHEETRTTSGSASGTNRVSSIRQQAGGRSVPSEAAELMAQPVVDRSSGRKLSSKEEALITMDGGLKELASLMRGVQVRLDAEGAQVSDLASDIKMLPALGQAQLDALRAVATQLEQQGRASERLLQTLGDLPGTLTGLRSTLDKVVATDERTANTLAEFRGAMDTIHASMREVVDHSKTQAGHTEKLLHTQDQRAERMVESLSQLTRNEKEKAEHLSSTLAQAVGGQREQTEKLARSLESSVSMAVQGATRDGGELREAVKGLQRSQDDSAKALRMAHEDQATRLQRMVEDGQRSNRSVLVVLVLIFVAILAAAGLLLLK